MARLASRGASLPDEFKVTSNGTMRRVSSGEGREKGDKNWVTTEKCEEIPLLQKLLSSSTPEAATELLQGKGFSRVQRQILARLAAMEEAWIDCDQAIKGNVTDMAQGIVAKLYEPYCFYRRTLGAVDPPSTEPFSLSIFFSSQNKPTFSNPL